MTKDIETEHIHIVHLSNKDLKDIQPLSKERIDSFEHIFAKHPIFFIFREKRNKTQRVEIEDSPKMDKILNRIYEKDGSLIWWEPHYHTKLIKKGDVAIVFGEKGMEEAQFLVDTEYPLKIIKADNI